MRHVPHLYLPPPWTDSLVPLPDSQVHHLRRVLRLAKGAPVSYTDGAGLVGAGALDGDGVIRGSETMVERPCDVSVAVAPPASRHRARYLVEKLAELGIERLLWLDTRHGEGRPPPESKVRSWVVSALEQSRGAWSMEVDTADWDDLDLERVVVGDPDGGEPGSVDRPILVIGPEGGWADGEVPEEARRVSLGSTVLRVETAAVVGAALLASHARRGR